MFIVLENVQGMLTLGSLWLDLEELLHQLGVGREGATHFHDRKRRSVTGRHLQDGCKHNSVGITQDWAEVECDSDAVYKKYQY